MANGAGANKTCQKQTSEFNDNIRQQQSSMHDCNIPCQTDKQTDKAISCQLSTLNKNIYTLSGQRYPSSSGYKQPISKRNDILFIS